MPIAIKQRFFSKPSTEAQRKTIVKIAVIIIALSAFFLLILPQFAHALSWGEYIYAEVMADQMDIWAGGEIDSAASILLGGNFGDEQGAATWGYLMVNSTIVKNLTNTMKVVGVIMLLVYIIMDAVREMERGFANMDMWLRLLVKVFLTLILLINVDLIINALAYAGQAIGEAMHNALKGQELKSLIMDQLDSEAMKEATMKSIEPDGLDIMHASIIMGFSTVRIMSLVAKIMVLLTKAISYSILFEICVRRIFMPVAVANFVGNGFSSPGVRWIKKYFAAYLRIAIVLTVLYLGWIAIASGALQVSRTVEVKNIYNSWESWKSWLAGTGFKTTEVTTSSINKNFLSIFAHIIAGNIAVKMFMGQTASYANDIMGV